MWPGATRSINYGQLAPDIGMVGLRDLFVVAPASSFHHPIISDRHSNPATALGMGVIPPPNISIDNEKMMSNRGRGGCIQLWQEQESQQHIHYLKKNVLLEHNSSSDENLLVHNGGITASISNSGGSSCQDCGNQAKKDCSHRRCRACCKTHGFHCVTHVKSTWVPAARRRERQLIMAATDGSSRSSSGAKKPRLIDASQTTTTSHTSTSNTTPPRSFDTSSTHQDASLKVSLPGQVRAQAVFKCVRVTAVDDGEDDQYAYQAVVKIGGHVFKGFLYDQGVQVRNSGSGAGGGRNGVSSSSPMMDLSDVYAASGGGLLGGSSTYGNPIN